MVKGQSKRKYTAEFRESAVRLATVEKRPVAEVAESLGMPRHTLIAWVNQARQGAGVFTPQDEKDLAVKVRELEAECRRLRIERDILKEATAFFAREGGQP